MSCTKNFWEIEKKYREKKTWRKNVNLTKWKYEVISENIVKKKKNL